MDRRRYLALSAGTLTALAGCSGGSGDETDPATEPETTPKPDPTEDTEEEGAKNGPSYQFEGEGEAVTDDFDVAGGLVTLALEHTGNEQFQLEAIGADKEQPFVDHAGPFYGELAVPLDPGEWHLDITADGAWRVNIGQPRFSEADLKPLPVEGGGDGQYADWFGPFEFEGTTEVGFEIDDESTARVWLADSAGQRVEGLHHATGPYEDVAETTQEGYGLVVVGGSTAEWSITIGG